MCKGFFFEFKEVGAIEEIVIPGKKDWRGKRYGFVRFVDISDVDLAEVKLNNLWLNGCKLSVNKSKYQRKSVNKLGPKVSILHRQGAHAGKGTGTKTFESFHVASANGGLGGE